HDVRAASRPGAARRAAFCCSVECRAPCGIVSGDDFTAGFSWPDGLQPHGTSGTDGLRSTDALDHAGRRPNTVLTREAAFALTMAFWVRSPSCGWRKVI